MREVNIEDEAGNITMFETEAEVHQAICGEIHNNRLYTAEQAPICQGRLRGEYGYTAVSPAVERVLNGTYDYDEDFDEHTRDWMNVL